MKKLFIKSFGKNLHPINNKNNILIEILLSNIY